MAAGQSMEGAQTSGGKEGTQDKNTEYPAAKDFLAKCSASGGSAVTTQGQDQRSHTESHARIGIPSPQSHRPEISSATHPMEDPSHRGNTY